ncbi:MAG TPA: hypothetical protein VL332_01160 [Candidatus Saccharimonadaceae bacterium]|nr:hypothetical protein [Candidatus Saccharimonadaceae bacterium]
MRSPSVCWASCLIVAMLVVPRVSSAATAADSVAAAASARLRLGADKWQHASLALSLGVGAGLVTRRTAPAVVVPAVLGLAKELRDTRHTRFDPLDLAADLVGAGLAGWLVSRIER